MRTNVHPGLKLLPTWRHLHLFTRFRFRFIYSILLAVRNSSSVVFGPSWHRAVSLHLVLRVWNSAQMRSAC